MKDKASKDDIEKIADKIRRALETVMMDDAFPENADVEWSVKFGKRSR